MQTEPDWERPLCQDTLRLVLKWEIQNLLQRLSAAGEESVVLTADINQNRCGPLASDRCSPFIQQAGMQDIQAQFLTFCKRFSEEGDNTDDTQSTPETSADSQKYGDPASRRIQATAHNNDSGARKHKHLSHSLARLYRHKRRPSLSGGSPVRSSPHKSWVGQSPSVLYGVHGINDVVSNGVPESPKKITMKKETKDGSKGTKRRKHTPVKIAPSYRDDDCSNSTDTSQHFVPSLLPTSVVKPDPNIILQGDNSGDQTADTGIVLQEGNSGSTPKGSTGNSSSAYNVPSSTIKEGDNSGSTLKGTNCSSMYNVPSCNYSENQENSKLVIKTESSSIHAHIRKGKRLRKKSLRYISEDSPEPTRTNSHPIKQESDDNDDISMAHGQSDCVELDNNATSQQSLSDSDVPMMMLASDLDSLRDDTWDGTPTTVMEPDGTMKIISLSVPLSLQELGEGAQVSHRRAGSGFKAAPADEDPDITELLDQSKRGVRQYQCPYCYLLVRDRHDLKRHLRTHTKEKPYPCRLCCRKFTRRWDLINHLRRFHNEPECSLDDDKYGQYDTRLSTLVDGAVMYDDLDIGPESVKQEVDQFVLTGNQSVFSNDHDNQYTDDGSQSSMILIDDEVAGSQESETVLVINSEFCRNKSVSNNNQSIEDGSQSESGMILTSKDIAGSQDAENGLVIKNM